MNDTIATVRELLERGEIDGSGVLLEALLAGTNADPYPVNHDVVKLCIDLADLLTQRMKHSAAQRWAQRGLAALARSGGSLPLRARAETCLGVCSWYLSGPSDSLAHFQSAAEILSTAADAPLKQRIKAQNDVGLVRHVVGQYDQSARDFRIGLDLATGLDDAKLKARTQRLLANLYQDHGLFDSSLEILRAIEPSAASDPAECLAWSNTLAMLFERMGDISSAERLFRQAITLFPRLKPPRSPYAAALSNAALLCLDLGRDNEAERLIRFMSLITGEASPLSAQVGILRVKARIAEHFGDLAKSAHLWHRAERLLAEKAPEDRSRIAEISATRSFLLWKIGEREHAKLALNAHLPVEPSAQLEPYQVDAAVLRALQFIEDQDLQHAESILIQSFVVELQRGQAESEWKLLAALAELAGCKGKLRAATLFGQLAVIAIGRSTTTLSGLIHERRSFLNARSRPFECLIENLVRLERLPEATAIQGRLLGERLFNFAYRDVRVDQRVREIPQRAIEQRLSFTYEELRNLSKRTRSQALDVRLESYEQNAAIEEGELLRQRGLNLAQEILQESWVPASGTPGSTMPTSEEESSKTCVLRFAFGTSEIAASATCGELSHAFKINASRGDLSERVFAFRQAIILRTAEYLREACQLYDLLVRPIAHLLRGADRLEILVAASLSYLPFACLHDGKRFLVEALPIAIRTGTQPINRQSSASFRIVAFGASHGTEGTSPLPHVIDEIAAVRAAAPRSVAYLDEQFTVRTLQSTLQNPPEVVHIACHFHLEPAAAHRSHFTVGDGTKLSLGVFRLGEFDLQGVQLLVLSGCDTATQDHGEFGVESLAGVMQSRGVKEVIGTLWSVADVGTARLMQNFYRNIETAGSPDAVAACLRAAQVTMLRGEFDQESLQNSSARGMSVEHCKSRFSHPYFWAGVALYVSGR